LHIEDVLQVVDGVVECNWLMRVVVVVLFIAIKKNDSKFSAI